MSLLDPFIPTPRLVEIDHVDVAVRPDGAEAVVRARAGATPESSVLLDVPGYGLAFGAIAVPERAGMTWHAIEPSAFALVDPPGIGKLAWGITLGHHGEHGTRIRIELRLDATDDATWFALRGSMRGLGPFGRWIQRERLAELTRDLDGVIEPVPVRVLPDDASGDLGVRLFEQTVTPFVRSRRSAWNVSRSLAERDHEGDELVERPRWDWTHAVEIAAAPEHVGALLGRAAPALPIVAGETGRWLLAHGRSEGENGSFADLSWLVCVEPLDDGGTRFLTRVRADYSDDVAERLLHGPRFVEPVGFVEDRRTLWEIKARAESAWPGVLPAPNPDGP